MFGPCSTFNAERLRNIFGNKCAPSRDISKYFARIQSIRYICQGGIFNGTEKCGSGLKKSMSIQMLNSVSHSTLNANKEIYILQEQLERHLAANLLLYPHCVYNSTAGQFSTPVSQFQYGELSDTTK
ncbi:hypothetical protein EMCRGX_G032179 [Ephydatia muelleri]